MKYEKARVQVIRFSGGDLRMSFHSAITYVDVEWIGRCGDFEMTDDFEFICYDYQTNFNTKELSEYNHLYKCITYGI